MALPAHMYVTGERQGDIRGSCTQVGREDSVLIEAARSRTYIPHDIQSGLSTGKRVHCAFSVTKHWDVSSPLLYIALCTGEQLDVRIDLWRPDPRGSGTEQQFFTIELDDAIVVAVHSRVHECRDPAVSNRPELEEILFTYSDITWTYEEGGIVATDSWHVPLGTKSRQASTGVRRRRLPSLAGLRRFPGRPRR